MIGVGTLVVDYDVCASTPIRTDIEKMFEIVVVFFPVDNGDAVYLVMNALETSAIAVLVDGITDVVHFYPVNG